MQMLRSKLATEPNSLVEAVNPQRHRFHARNGSCGCTACSIANHLKSGKLRFVVVLIFQEFPFHEEERWPYNPGMAPVDGRSSLAWISTENLSPKYWPVFRVLGRSSI